MSKEQEVVERYNGKNKSNGVSMKASNDVSEKEANAKKKFKSKAKALKNMC